MHGPGNSHSWGCSQHLHSAVVLGSAVKEGMAMSCEEFSSIREELFYLVIYLIFWGRIILKERRLRGAWMPVFRWTWTGDET